MPRPHLYSFLLFQTKDELSLRGSVNITDHPEERRIKLDEKNMASPFKSLGLFKQRECRVRIIGTDTSNQICLDRSYVSDSLGSFNLKIPLSKKIKYVEIYETSTRAGLELLLGTFIPIYLFEHFNVVVSDFDKTLVETKFSSLKEIFGSLKNPISNFPNIKKSIDLFKSHINEGNIPFILSASPHFYEDSLRDWIYENEFFGAHLLLKDYRSIFSFKNGPLIPKDMKRQGFYKLTQLVDLFLMTGVPDSLILMGDVFESDTFIYLSLLSVLVHNEDPWFLWKKIKKESPFRLSSKQNSMFLTKFYRLFEMSKRKPLKNYKIYIRGISAEEKIKIDHLTLPLPSMDKLKSSVTFYTA